MHTPTPRLVACALATAIAVAQLSSRAEPSIAERSLADQLFRDAIKLMEDGKLEAACPKFAESYRLDPVGGTQFNLAMCHELAGRFATAYTLFNEVALRSKKEGRAERLQKCKDHLESIEPKLSRLSVSVSKEAEAIAGLEVRIDGVLLGKPSWQTAMPLDPGAHRVVATAPGKQSWQATVTLSAVADKKSVVVPVLVDDPKETRVADAKAPVADAPSVGTRTAGLVIGGIGVAGIAGSVFFAFRAQGLRTDAESLHAAGDSAAYDRNDEANRSSLVAKLSLGIGLVATGIGAYLYLRSPNVKSGTGGGAIRLWGSATPAGGLIAFGGAW